MSLGHSSNFIWLCTTEVLVVHVGHKVVVRDNQNDCSIINKFLVIKNFQITTVGTCDAGGAQIKF